MYGLPSDFDPSVFVGHKLNLLSFTENTIHFAFDGDIAITTTSSFVHVHSLHEPGRKHVVPVESSRLMSLVGKTVSRSSAEPGGTLSLHFEDGEQLSLLDDSREYESYTVRVGDKEFIV